MIKIYCSATWRFKWHILAMLLISFESKAYVQDSSSITIHVSDTPIENVFRQIEKQTGYSFYYSKPTLNGNELVSVSLKQASISSAMNAILKGKNVTWQLKDGGIILSRRIAPSNISTDSVPRINISGQIIDPQGNPIPGASIILKGQNRGQGTDNSGRFSMANIPPNSVLTISSVGYDPKQVKVSGMTELRISLDTLVREIKGIEVVSTGYQTISKERATGSFAQSDKIIFNNRVSTDVLSRLEGITNGLVFNRSASGAPSIEIRGRSTINADASPLIIVDNFPYDGDINNINPNDILDITVLKDAAAASIWGARAGNGVIVLTTKKGKYNQPLQVNVTANLALANKPDLSYNRDYISSNEYIELEQSLFAKGFYNANISNTTTFPVLSPVVQILAKQRAGTITEAEATAQINALRNNDIREDYKKYFYQKLANQQYALSLNGGNQNSSYILSIGYDKNQPLVQGNKDNRITINSFTTFKPIPKLELSGGLNYTKDKTFTNNALNQLQASNIQPYVALKDANGNPLPVAKDFNSDFIQSRPALGFLNWQYFPLADKELEDNTTTLSDIRLRAGLKYTILPGLSIEGLYQYSNGANTQRTFRPEESYYTRNLINRYAQFSGTAVTDFNIPRGGILQGSNSSYTSDNTRVQLNYNKIIERHEISALAGFEQREVKGEFKTDYDLYGYNPINDSYRIVDYTKTYTLNPTSAGTTNRIPGSFSTYHTTNRYRSFFGNLSYTYNGLYMLYGSARVDQANLFGVKSNDKQVPLWSIGGKWNLSNEKFFSSSWLTQLQLRSSYGFSGNLLNNGTAYTTAQYYSTPGIYFPNEQYQVQSPGNPNLTWEKIGIVNIGVDFAIKKNILTGSLEFYSKHAKDLIGLSNIPSNSGFSSVTLNYGGMKGKGVDLVLNSENLKREISWTSSFLFSYTQDQVTRYDENVTGGRLDIVEGKPVNSVFANRWAGLDPATGDPRGYDTSGNISTNYVFLEAMQTSKKKWIGRSTPSVFGGFRNTFGYKGLSLSINLSYKFNYFFIRKSIKYNNLFNLGQAHTDYTQRWQKPGDENTTIIPSLPSLPPNATRDQFFSNSEVLATKGDHIRLQDIIINYQLDCSKKKDLPFNRLSFSVLFNNLGVIWKANKYGIDPDFQQTRYLQPTTFTFSIKAGL